MRTRLRQQICELVERCERRAVGTFRSVDMRCDEISDIYAAKAPRRRFEILKRTNQLAARTRSVRRVALANGVDELTKVLAVANELETEAVLGRRRRAGGRFDDTRSVVAVEQRRNWNDVCALAAL